MKKLYRFDYLALYHQTAMVEAESPEEARALLVCEMNARLNPGAHRMTGQRVEFSSVSMIGGAQECAARSAEAGTPEADRLRREALELTNFKVETAFSDKGDWHHVY